MVRSGSDSTLTESGVTPFLEKLQTPLTKQPIRTLQINLGKRCNLACRHCHVEAGPKRTEELSPDICEQLIELIVRFPQIQTVDLTGGAPEMNYGFRAIAEAARQIGKQVIVRSNLTIVFEPGFEDLPDYFAQHQLQIIASLPCYLSDNVDQQRGAGVYDASIRAIQALNARGYGRQPELGIDLVFNPQLPKDHNFAATPAQATLEQTYKAFLKDQFGIDFNRLFTITNLPIGRIKGYLERHDLYIPYLHFLASYYNPDTVAHLMCRRELSIDYLGNIFDCDFNQMEHLWATTPVGDRLTVTKLLELGHLDVIEQVKTSAYCYGCTAGHGSSCGGALV